MKLSDSRTIYNVTRHTLSNVEWQNATVDNGAWVFYSSIEKFEADFIEPVVIFLRDINIYVSLSRTESFVAVREELVKYIGHLIGKYDFTLWSSDLKRVVEVSKVGVLRYGTSKNAN